MSWEETKRAMEEARKGETESDPLLDAAMKRNAELEVGHVEATRYERVQSLLDTAYAKLQAAESQLDAVTTERDAARREICAIDKYAAEMRGWGYLFEGKKG